MSDTKPTVQSRLSSIVEAEIDKLPDLFNQIEKPEDKINAIAKLLPYSLPRLTPSVNMSIESNEVLRVGIVLSDGTEIEM